MADVALLIAQAYAKGVAEGREDAAKAIEEHRDRYVPYSKRLEHAAFRRHLTAAARIARDEQVSL